MLRGTDTDMFFFLLSGETAGIQVLPTDYTLSHTAVGKCSPTPTESFKGVGGGHISAPRPPPNCRSGGKCSPPPHQREWVPGGYISTPRPPPDYSRGGCIYKCSPPPT